jgi:hypothetical protein
MKDFEILEDLEVPDCLDAIQSKGVKSIKNSAPSPVVGSERLENCGNPLQESRK